MLNAQTYSAIGHRLNTAYALDTKRSALVSECDGCELRVSALFGACIVLGRLPARASIRSVRGGSSVSAFNDILACEGNKSFFALPDLLVCSQPSCTSQKKKTHSR